MTPSVDKLDQAEALLRDLEAVEAKLRLMQEGLTRSHRLTTLGTMAAIIAHEFNNILTPIISYCQLSQAHPEDAALKNKAIERALGGAERAAQICSSILGFARAADTETAADVAAVLGEVFACLARDPARDGIKVTMNVPEGTLVAMPPVNLQQVLLNLVLNARQAMSGQRSGKLTITAARARGLVTIDISDTGAGIAAKIRSQLFQPFVTHREEGDAHSPRGTGLGLAICRDLVEQAGGHIDVARTGGDGTTFRIQLPAASV